MMASERDPYDLVPNGFYEKWDSVQEASMYAGTTTDAADRTRCPECDSTNLRYRPGPVIGRKCEHAGKTLYVCRNCGAEFDEPEGEE